MGFVILHILFWGENESFRRISRATPDEVKEENDQSEEDHIR